MKRLKRFFLFWPFFLLLLLPILLLGWAIIPKSGMYIYGWDIEGYVFFAREYFKQRILGGHIPFWNPYGYAGTPYLANPGSNEIYYPGTWLFIIFPFSYALSIFYVLHIYIAGLGMYLCMRRYADRVASIFSASAYAMSGYIGAQIFLGHIDQLITHAWMPFVILTMSEVFRTPDRRHILYAVGALLLECLSGSQINIIFTLELCGLFIIWNAILTLPRERYGAIVHAVKKLFILVGVLIVVIGIWAVHLIPASQLASLAIRKGGLSYEQASGGSYQWSMLKLFIDPYAFGNPFTKQPDYFGPWPNFFEYLFFTGKITVFLALLGIVISAVLLFRRKGMDAITKETLFFCFALLFFILMALGANTPVHKFMYTYVPIYRLFRIPGRHLLMGVFLSSALAGLGLTRLRWPLVKMVCVLLVMYELFVFRQPYIKLSTIPVNTNPPALISQLQQPSGSGRTYVHYQTWDSARTLMDLNGGWYYKQEFLNGYDPTVIANYYHFIDLVDHNMTSSIEQYPLELPPINPHSPHMNFLNVKYIVVPTSLDDITGKDPQRFVERSRGQGYIVYENTKVSPRFFLTGKGISFATTDMLDNAIRAEEDLSKTTLFLQKDTPSDVVNTINCPKDIGSVTQVKYREEAIILHVQSNCDAILSSSEVYFPGWKASIDGVSVPIHLANGAFRSLFIPKGEHFVQMWYDPWIFEVGAGVSLGTLLLVGLMIHRVPSMKST